MTYYNGFHLFLSNSWCKRNVTSMHQHWSHVSFTPTLWNEFWNIHLIYLVFLLPGILSFWPEFPAFQLESTDSRGWLYSKGSKRQHSSWFFNFDTHISGCFHYCDLDHKQGPNAPELMGSQWSWISKCSRFPWILTPLDEGMSTLLRCLGPVFPLPFKFLTVILQGSRLHNKAPSSKCPGIPLSPGSQQALNPRRWFVTEWSLPLQQTNHQHKHNSLVTPCYKACLLLNTLKQRQNDHHFPDIFKCIFLNENV